MESQGWVEQATKGSIGQWPLDWKWQREEKQQQQQETPDDTDEWIGSIEEGLVLETRDRLKSYLTNRKNKIEENNYDDNRDV